MSINENFCECFRRVMYGCYCRLIIKAPQAKPRKDSGLHNVIISETKDNSVAKHQVSVRESGCSNPTQDHQLRQSLSWKKSKKHSHRN